MDKELRKQVLPDGKLPCCPLSYRCYLSHSELALPLQYTFWGYFSRLQLLHGCGKAEWIR